MIATEESSRCDFRLDPGAWERSHDGKCHLDSAELNGEGIWRCPHEQADGHSKCLFHLPVSKKDADDVRRAFVTSIEEPDVDGDIEQQRRSRQFIGATFEGFSLSRVVLSGPTNHPIDLRHATVAGDLTWKASRLSPGVRAHALRVDGEVDFDLTTFEQGAVFRGSVFEGDVSFRRVTFAHDARFPQVRFGGNARFTRASFETQALFVNATFSGDAWFHGAEFQDTAEFSRGLTIEGKAEFAETSFTTDITFGGACLHTPSGGRLNFTGSYLGAGVLRVDPDRGWFDLTEATLGDISIHPSGAVSEMLDAVRFRDTVFEGFDFGDPRHREALIQADWDLHTDGQQFGESPTAVEREVTFLKAKNGANQVGDSRAAAEFFQREMSHRRHGHAGKAIDDDLPLSTRLFVAFDWVKNGLFGLISGYGERPLRTVGSSFVVIAAFTALYTALSPSPVTGFSEAVSLSVGSFVTLILGNVTGISDPWFALLVQLEGLVGGFLIALFVFTLTRAIHR